MQCAMIWHDMDSLRGSSDKIGTIQRRLAWPILAFVDDAAIDFVVSIGQTLRKPQQKKMRKDDTWWHAQIEKYNKFFDMTRYGFGHGYRFGNEREFIYIYSWYSSLQSYHTPVCFKRQSIPQIPSKVVPLKACFPKIYTWWFSTATTNNQRGMSQDSSTFFHHIVYTDTLW